VAGDYEVRAKAKDDKGGESGWSDPLSIHILQAPIMNIGVISGGFLKANTLIKNNGEVEATNVQWSITLDGGTILMGKESNGEIPSIPPGGSEPINSGLILGFGKTQITVTAEILEGTDTRTQGATVLLFFIKINPGGGI
ncbi:MAG: Zn-dependent exopeptidase M28, partial [Thermoplasmatales archaeon]|nr:Zn-dependent exopeptidase M28 [Thermoplasmatales archaeon]